MAPLADALTLARPLVAGFEGCRLVAYRCPAGVWTVGYGTTGPEIHEGTVWTQAQADARLDADLRRFASAVLDMAAVDLEPHELAALTSFAFNVGPGHLRASTLLRKLNAGDRQGAAAEFARWNQSGGRVLPGLARRRTAERRLFLSGRFRMKNLTTFLLDRARERSTWLGLIAVASAFGVYVSPEQAEAIATAGVAVAGAVGILTRDGLTKDRAPE